MSVAIAEQKIARAEKQEKSKGHSTTIGKLSPSFGSVKSGQYGFGEIGNVAVYSSGSLPRKTKTVQEELQELRMQVAELKAELKKEIAALAKAVRENQTSSFCTFITTLGSNEIDVKRPIPVTIENDEGCFIASFLEANSAIGGDSIPEAVANLQAMLAELFTALTNEDDSALGPEMVRQKRILLEVLCRKS